MSNIEVFYTQPDMYLIKLFTCIECGEIFVIDFENSNLAGKTAGQIAGNTTCPKCRTPLRESIRSYPENFRANNGQIGHFKPERIIPPDSDSLVMAFLELV